MTNHSQFWNHADWVSPDIIRERFNQEQFFEQVQRGDLRQRVLKPDNHLSRRQREKINEPRCTRSQMVLYATKDGKPVALVHQYRRPDGQIGASGRPDPKRLFVSGRVMAVRQIT